VWVAQRHGNMGHDAENQQHAQHGQDAVAHLFLAQRLEYYSPVHLLNIIPATAGLTPLKLFFV